MFKAWYCNVFYEVVLHHHDAEEDIYFPWIAEKVAFENNRTTLQHDELKKLMEEIKSKCDKNEMDGLGDLLTKLAKLMKDHLDEEERMVPDMLRKTGYTAQQEQAVIGKIVEGLGPQGNALFLPIITHAMDLAGGYGPTMNKTIFMSVLPPPVQEAFPQFEEGFKKNNLSVLEALTK